MQREPLWTADELASYLKLNPYTLREWLRKGLVLAIKLGHEWRIRGRNLRPDLLCSV